MYIKVVPSVSAFVPRLYVDGRKLKTDTQLKSLRTYTRTKLFNSTGLVPQ